MASSLKNEFVLKWGERTITKYDVTCRFGDGTALSLRLRAPCGLRLLLRQSQRTKCSSGAGFEPRLLAAILGVSPHPPFLCFVCVRAGFCSLSLSLAEEWSVLPLKRRNVWRKEGLFFLEWRNPQNRAQVLSLVLILFLIGCLLVLHIKKREPTLASGRSFWRRELPNGRGRSRPSRGHPPVRGRSSDPRCEPTPDPYHFTTRIARSGYGKRRQDPE